MPAIPTARVDLYAFFHKGLRVCLAETLARVGRVDTADPAEVHDVCDDVRALLVLSHAHLDLEERFIHVAVEARVPGALGPTADQHVEHLDEMRRLNALVEQFDHSWSDERALAAARLYRALAHFVAENLAHMEVEESENNAVLWSAFSDAELGGMQRAIVAASGPAEKAAVGRWVVPNLAPMEQTSVIDAMRRSAPAQAVESMLEEVRKQVAPRAWAKLERATGRAA